MARKPISKPSHGIVTKSKQLKTALGDSLVGGDTLPRRGKKPRKQVVSPKVRRLVNILVDNPDMTLSKAGTKAGFLKNPAQGAYAALKSASAQELFRREMAKRDGLQFSKLAEKLEQGLEATQTKFFAHEGQVVDERDVVDYGARHAYLALAAKLAGVDPATRMELTGKDGEKLIPPSNNTLVVLPQLSTEQLLALLEIKEPADVSPPIPAEAVKADDIASDITNTEAAS
jgi:hypothetical protein